MKTWHIFLHRLEMPLPRPARGEPIFGWKCLDLSPTDIAEPMTVMFDEACVSINSLPGGYCEPDGAFGWNPSADRVTRIGGTLHAFDERVMCVEIFGSIDPVDWANFSGHFGTDSELVVQVVERGVFLPSTDFKELL
jgi:hypothetical protein